MMGTATRKSFRATVAALVATICLIVGQAMPASAHIVGSSQYMDSTPVFLAFFWYCPVTGGQTDHTDGTGIVYSASTLSLGSATSSCTSTSAVNVNTTHVDGWVVRWDGSSWATCGSSFSASASNTWYAVSTGTKTCGSGYYAIFMNYSYVSNAASPSIYYQRTIWQTQNQHS